jgi:methionyl-tRNA formyltransferase
MATGPKTTKPENSWNILLVGAFRERLTPALSEGRDELVMPSDPEKVLSLDYLDEISADCIVSFGYGRILTPDLLKRVLCVNLHGGLLPLHRGPNPHLWTILSQTGRGATFHHIDVGIDTGDIISQIQVPCVPEDTSFESSFARLVDDCVCLFERSWHALRWGTPARIPQQESGSSHTFKDQAPLEAMWSDGSIALSVREFRKRALELLQISFNEP